MRLNPKENPGLPFDPPVPVPEVDNRTDEQVEADVLKKIEKGDSKLNFNKREAEIYSRLIEKERQEMQDDRKGGLYGQRH